MLWEGEEMARGRERASLEAGPASPYAGDRKVKRPCTLTACRSHSHHTRTAHSSDCTFAQLSDVHTLVSSPR
jgi:hypothetical protein